ncbi:uncharacterized protein LOC129610823 [Condylostylus longicornis]|uniref:uncharacterized protein LOC129610823 n=1 Tax=Condylostylus longicornis TaxID=2530218 RepID=UPI00244E34C6|nr:uncharacterized protein LOC129610823 [Condylostylus longicornis]
MKFFLITLCVAATVLSTEANLKDDFREIGALVPVDRVKAIVAKHLTLNKLFGDFIKFVKTDEFSKLWSELVSNAEFRGIVTYIESSGYKLSEDLNKLAELLKVARYPDDELVIMPRTVNSFLRDLLNAMPKDDISTLMKLKMKTSPEFNTFMTRLNHPDFKGLVDKFLTASSTANIRNTLSKKGVDLKKIFEKSFEILKWSQ